MTDTKQDELKPLSDEEFDALHGGRELLPIEQVAYEAEGAERFAKYHGRALLAAARSQT